MKNKLLLMSVSILIIACKASKPQYRVTEQGTKIYSKSKSGITKDILSNGDTLVSTGTEIYILKRKL